MLLPRFSAHMFSAGIMFFAAAIRGGNQARDEANGGKSSRMQAYVRTKMQPSTGAIPENICRYRPLAVSQRETS